MIIVVTIVFLLVMLLIGLYLYKKDKPMSFEDVVKNISNKSTKNNKRKI